MRTWRRFGFILLGLLWIGGSSFSFQLVQAKTVEELRDELRGKRDSLKEAEERIEKFKQTIQAKKQEARTLESQIVLLDDNIGELELSIDRTVAEIDTTDSEVEGVTEEIRITEEEMAHQKTLLVEYIRALHSIDQQSTVSVLLTYDTFSEAINETATFAELHSRAQQTLTTIHALRDELESKRRDLEDFRETLEALRRRQEGERSLLSSQQASKERLLDLTNQQEEQFRGLLQQSQAAHQAAQADIKQIDTLIREELRKQGLGNLGSVGRLSYPIDPVFGVSCEFHCAGYPYAYLIGPHSGMDIPAYVGTPIQAPADGYVARAHEAPGTGYSYIMLIHGDNLTTVFGHVSGFAVREGERVTRGTIIGYTGGAPGTRGSGLSSGPHLHFEVRQNNVAVNPRQYL